MNEQNTALSIGQIFNQDPTIREILNKPEKISPPVQRSDPRTALKQSNLLTEARFDFSSLELNLFALCLHAMKQQGPEAMYSLYYFELSRLVAIMGESNSNLANIRKAAKKLVNEPIEIEDRETGAWTYSRLIAGVRVSPQTDRLFFTIDHFMKPYYFELLSNFTLIFLEAVFALRSKYAKRIYVMCARFRDTGKFQISSAELRERLGIKPGQYLNGGMFKKRVLDVALAEINEASDLRVTLVSHFRKGQKNEFIEFAITNNGPEIRKANNPNLWMRLKSTGLSESAINSILLDLDEQTINRVLYDAKLAEKSGHIKGTIAAYLRGCFSNHGAKFETTTKKRADDRRDGGNPG